MNKSESEDRNKVKLIFDRGPTPSSTFGPIEVEVTRSASKSSDPSPTLAIASKALQDKALELGANAVVTVEYSRQKPRFWSMSPKHILKAKGTAVALSPSDYDAAKSNAEEMGLGLDIEDPESALSSRLTVSGISSIVWAVVNTAIVMVQVRNLGPYERLIIPPGLLYTMSVFLLISGLLILEFKRKPAMLLLDGIALLLLGILNIAGQAIGFLGVLQVVWGLQSLFGYGVVVRAIEQHNEFASAYEKKRRSLHVCTNTGSNPRGNDESRQVVCGGCGSQLPARALWCPKCNAPPKK